MTYVFDYAMVPINKTQQKNDSVPPLPKNNRNINLTTIANKVHKAMLFDRILPEIEKIHLKKNQNGIRRN